MLIASNESIGKVLAAIVFKTASSYPASLESKEGSKLLFYVLRILPATWQCYFSSRIDVLTAKLILLRH